MRADPVISPREFKVNFRNWYLIDKPQPIEEPPERSQCPKERDEPTPMEGYPASVRVGNANHDDAMLMEPQGA